MDCQSIQENLLDMNMGERDRQRARQVLRHLDECATCRAAARDYDTLRETISDKDGPDAPPDGWGAFDVQLPASTASQSHRLLRIGAGLAAAMAISLLGFELGRWASTPRTFPQSFAPRRARRRNGPLALTSADISRQVRAFKEVSGFFDGRAAWLVLADGASDMGVTQQAMAPPSILLLRLSMTAGRKTVSTADLAIVPGETARLTVPLKDGGNARYDITTSTAHPTRLSIWAEVQTRDDGRTLAALATSIDLEPDQKAKVGQLVTSAGAYDLNLAFTQAAIPAGAR